MPFFAVNGWINPRMSRKKPENLSFEEALDELETLVEHLEAGEITLDDSLKTFERGVALYRSGREQLEKAEKKVEILADKTLHAQPEPFSSDDQQ